MKSMMDSRADGHRLSTGPGTPHCHQIHDHRPHSAAANPHGHLLLGQDPHHDHSGPQSSPQQEKHHRRTLNGPSTPPPEDADGLDFFADPSPEELTGTPHALLTSLQAAAKEAGAPECIEEIAASLTPVLVARQRLRERMEGYQERRDPETIDPREPIHLPQDKASPWERTPRLLPTSRGGPNSPAHRFHQLARGTEVADLAMERLPKNTKADLALLRLAEAEAADGRGALPSPLGSPQPPRRPRSAEACVGTRRRASVRINQSVRRSPAGGLR